MLHELKLLKHKIRGAYFISQLLTAIRGLHVYSFVIL